MSPNTITKRELRLALGFDTDAELATFFDVSPAAISQWGEDDPIPSKRLLEIRLERPDLVARVLAARNEEHGNDGPETGAAMPGVQGDEAHGAVGVHGAKNADKRRVSA